MDFRKRLVDSFLISSAVLIGSFVVPFIPCRSAPAVPNPSFSWGFCSLSPDRACSVSSLVEYFGYTQSLSDAFFLTLLLSFFASLLVFHYLSRRSKK